MFLVFIIGSLLNVFRNRSEVPPNSKPPSLCSHDEFSHSDFSAEYTRLLRESAKKNGLCPDVFQPSNPRIIYNDRVARTPIQSQEVPRVPILLGVLDEKIVLVFFHGSAAMEVVTPDELQEMSDRISAKAEQKLSQQLSRF